MDKRKYIVDAISRIVSGTASERVQTAEMIVERLTEEGVLHLGYGNVDIDKVVTTFADTFGTTKTTKYDRFAAGRLVKKYGADSVAGIIKLLGQKSQEPYAPVPNSVAQLEEKMPSVLSFLRKQNSSVEIV